LSEIDSYLSDLGLEIQNNYSHEQAKNMFDYIVKKRTKIPNQTAETTETALPKAELNLKESAIEIKRKSNEVKFNSLKEWMNIFNYRVLVFIFTIIGILLGSILTFNSGAVVKCGSAQFFCQIFTLNKK
jgi:hypothetical protein